ncbi:hypothetical protein B0H14DRAFT_3441818 [Mycena olivaceomarginata]|nr:hypothetical protein B0H14DRAFT_3441818 [Mycena olivaceomarginata]
MRDKRECDEIQGNGAMAQRRDGATARWRSCAFTEMDGEVDTGLKLSSPNFDGASMARVWRELKRDLVRVGASAYAIGYFASFLTPELLAGIGELRAQAFVAQAFQPMGGVDVAFSAHIPVRPTDLVASHFCRAFLEAEKVSVWERRLGTQFGLHSEVTRSRLRMGKQLSSLPTPPQLVRRSSGRQEIRIVNMTSRDLVDASFLSTCCDYHANIAPIHLRLNRSVYNATARLAALPASNPICGTFTRCRRIPRFHRSPIHHLIAAFHIFRNDFETINPLFQVAPLPESALTTSIAPNKDAARTENRDGQDCATSASSRTGWGSRER